MSALTAYCMSPKPRLMRASLALLLLLLPALSPLVSQAADFQTYWIPVNPLPTTLNDHKINSIASNGSIANPVTVIAADDGAIWSSNDNTTWTPRLSHQALDYTDVIWNSAANNGNGEFAVVANRVLSTTTDQYHTSTFATSPDGITWTEAQVINDVRLFSLAHNDTGRYVAVGNNGNIAYSDNGVTWTIANVPYDYRKAFINILWDSNNSQFILVGGSSGNPNANPVIGPFGFVMTSPDGATWVSQNPATPWTTMDALKVGDLKLNAIATDGGNQYLIVGEDCGFATSSNGINWTASPTPTIANCTSILRSISYSPGLNRFVAVGDNGTISYYERGTWTKVTTPAFATAKQLKDVIWDTSHNQYIASGVGLLMTSTNGINWVEINSSSTSKSHWSDIVWNDTQYLIVSENGQYGTSSNGQAWSFGTGTAGIKSLTWEATANNGAGRYVAIQNGTTIITSTNGTSWTPLSSPPGVLGLNGICWNSSNGHFIAVGDAVGNSAQILRSTDGGLNWNTLTAPVADYQDVIWTGSQYVAVGLAGKIAFSPDGLNWSGTVAQDNFRQPLSNENMLAVSWNDHQFIAAGYTTVNTTDANNNPITVDKISTIHSEDGMIWTYPLELHSDEHLTGISWNPATTQNSRRHIAVGSNGTILASAGTDLDVYTSVAESDLATANDPEADFYYTFTVTNQGDFTATDITLTMTLTNDFTVTNLGTGKTVESNVDLISVNVISGAGAQCNPTASSDQMATCTISVLNPLETASFRLAVKPTVFCFNTIDNSSVTCFDPAGNATLVGTMRTTVKAVSAEPEAVPSDNIFALTTTVQSLESKLNQDYVDKLNSGSGSMNPMVLVAGLLCLALLPRRR